MSSAEDEGSDVDLSQGSDGSISDNSEVGVNIARVNTRGPWFSVVEPNTFVIATLPAFTANHGPVEFEPNCSPCEYFEHFINEEDNSLFEIITDETNRYATATLNGNDATPQARGNSWKPVSKEEISAFFGLVFAMGIVRKPTYASYWEKGEFDNLMETPNFSRIMSRNRFQAILRFLHCNDNDLAVQRGEPGYDPLHKVSNVIEFFNRTFENNYR